MEEQKYADGQIIEISLDAIVRDENQPRKHFDEEAIEALATSIRHEGLVQNIVVRPVGDGKFKIVAGERRYRAFKKLAEKEGGKWGTIQVIIREVDDQKALNLALLENIQREDLLPIERAEAIKEYKERNGITEDKELVDKIGLSAPSISNILHLLKLDDSIKEEVRGCKDYALRELIKISKKRKKEAQLELFEELKKKIATGKSRVRKAGTDAVQTPEQEEANVKRLFPRCATEVRSLSEKPVETFETYKFNAARAVRYSLDCLEKLAEVKDAVTIDLTKKHTLKELKDALDKLIAQEPQPEQKAEEPKGAKTAEAEKTSEPVVEKAEEQTKAKAE